MAATPARSQGLENRPTQLPKFNRQNRQAGGNDEEGRTGQHHQGDTQGQDRSPDNGHEDAFDRFYRRQAEK